MWTSCGRLSKSRTLAGMFVVRPPGNPPRKVRALTDILLEHFGNNS
jgi:hypothetical protein